jgi:DNA-directed RNA polymerase subunit RPC12/RpoP
MSEEIIQEEHHLAPIAESLLNKVLEVPCPSCAGKLLYDADHQKISCKYCGYKEDFDKANDRVTEQGLFEAIEKSTQFSMTSEGKHVYNCSGCGSKVMLDKAEVHVRCSFCGSKNVNEEAFESNYIQPAGIIAFKNSEAKAQEIYKEWIGKGFFTPKKLKTGSFVNNLQGVYIPFWTYDADTQSQWCGYAGKYYYVTKTRYVNGKTESYQEQRTEWIWREGVHAKFFDDVLVSSSRGAAQNEVQKIFPYNLKEVVNFNPKLLLGWEAEIYNIDVKNGYRTAEEIMNNTIHDECTEMLRMDTYRDLQVRTQKSAQTFKHLLLPLWICSYDYNGKIYKFLVNGQTGKIEGSKPIDKMKVAICIIIGIIILLILFFLFKK